MNKDYKQFTCEGIGTHWWINVYDDIDDATWSQLGVDILYCIQTFDNLYSRFKPDSFIGILNREKKLLNFPQELFAMLDYANKIKEVTSGYFDVCVGTYLENLGYDQDFSFKEHEIPESKEEASVKLDFTEQEIHISTDTKIDLGGIGKGWLIDKIKLIIESHNIKYYFINGGGDIYASSNYDKAFEFTLENPFNVTEQIGKINIKNQSIACSSGARRRWKSQQTGKIYHHLVSAKSGNYQSEVEAVFTLGPTALNADTASTAIYVSSLDLAFNIADLLQIEYLIVFTNGNFVKSDGYVGILNT